MFYDIVEMKNAADHRHLIKNNFIFLIFIVNEKIRKFRIFNNNNQYFLHIEYINSLIYFLNMHSRKKYIL